MSKGDTRKGDRREGKSSSSTVSECTVVAFFADSSFKQNKQHRQGFDFRGGRSDLFASGSGVVSR